MIERKGSGCPHKSDFGRGLTLAAALSGSCRSASFHSMSSKRVPYRLCALRVA